MSFIFIPTPGLNLSGNDVLYGYPSTDAAIF